MRDIILCIIDLESNVGIKGLYDIHALYFNFDYILFSNLSMIFFFGPLQLQYDQSL